MIGYIMRKTIAAYHIDILISDLDGLSQKPKNG